MGDAAHRAREAKAVRLVKFTFPAAFSFLGESVETLGDVGGRILSHLGVAGDFWPQNPSDCGFFDHSSVIAAVQAVQRVADSAGMLHRLAQVLAGDLLAVCEAKD